MNAEVDAEMGTEVGSDVVSTVDFEVVSGLATERGLLK